ncbi:hypothetical protein FFLO_01607 [Filobasidium floriforme]|uniref:Homologous-pairing protein 2 winged helix domain-containing protein n=1 Tax=Filobasidium floriforme TaxID=5210 RepID=A0A8K0JQB5_9TREE|nr:hypothetical protein FFLO_01607 [Filobasidium floriforme]
MPAKAATKSAEKAVKGDEVYQVVLKYLKQVNRPYAATDISANLKNKVTKTNAQKVLGSLADKGLLTCKTYGKQSIYVYNQANLETLPAEGLADIDNDIKVVADDLEAVKKKLKNVGAAVANLTAQPKTEDLPATLKRIQAENDALVAALTPLRKAATGGEDKQDNNGQAGPMSKADIEAIEKEWQKWRKEWVSRKRNYLGLLDGVQTDASPAERLAFQEESGIDLETPEMVELEASELCKPPAPKKIMLAGGGTGAKTNVKAVVQSPGAKRKRS